MKHTFSIYAVGLLTGLATACSDTPRTAPQAPAVPVEVYQAVSRDTSAIAVSGTLTARQSAQISTRMMAYVDEVLVKPGDRVQAGQLLIRLNAKDILAQQEQVTAQLKAAELAAENAARDYQRYKNLHAQGSVSDKELENMLLHHTLATAQLQTARQSLEEVRAQLAYTQIKAPFTGRVTQKHIDRGGMASPGMPLLTLEQSQELEATATVPEHVIAHVKAGQQVDVEVKTLQRTLSGTIRELSPSASLQGGQYAMKIALAQPTAADLLAGMYVAIRIPLRAGAAPASGLWIDRESLVSREQLQGVYVMNDNGQAVMRWLQLGKTRGDQVEVLSGLRPDEKVIRKAEGRLYNGQRVTVTP